MFQKVFLIPFIEMIVKNGRDKQPGKNSKKPAYKEADVERKQNERTIISVRLSLVGFHRAPPCVLPHLVNDLDTGLEFADDPKLATVSTMCKCVVPFDILFCSSS